MVKRDFAPFLVTRESKPILGGHTVIRFVDLIRSDSSFEQVRRLKDSTALRHCSLMLFEWARGCFEFPS